MVDTTAFYKWLSDEAGSGNIRSVAGLRVTGESGAFQGRSVVLEAPATVGRDSSNNIAIPTDVSVSRQHLKLYEAQGAWFCVDLGSANGTYLDGKRVGTEPVLIPPSSQLKFGAQVWKLESGPANLAQVARFDKGDGRNTCRRCGQKMGFLTTGARGLCKECTNQLAKTWDQFKEAFAAIVRSSPLLSTAHVEKIRETATRLGLPLSEALEPLKEDCLAVLRRQLNMAKHDGVVDEQEARVLRHLQASLCLSEADAEPIWREVSLLNRMQEVRTGKLTAIQAPIQMPAGELCYFYGAAVYHRGRTASVLMINGHLAITSKRLIFMSSTDGFDVALGKVAQVQVADYQGIFLGLTRQKGTGYYRIDQALLVVATLEALLEKHHRTALVVQAASRTVPQHVKGEVWSRDNGQCVECGSTSYLEFDHIIPFSMGGATSVQNLQLLCRACNLSKGDRL